MKLYNEIVTPFNEEKEIDVEIFNELITQSLKKGNDKVIIFTPFGDGNLLSLNEIEALVNSIDIHIIDKVILYVQLKNNYEDNKIISFINRTNISSLLISPPLGSYSQNGLLLYLKGVLKKLKSKTIYLQNSPNTNQTCFHFQTLRKLIKTNHNLVGLYENSNDFSLINLLKQNFNSFEILVNEKNLDFALKKQIDGLISLNSFLFADSYQEVIADNSCGFKNKILIDYLSLAHEILYFSNNSTLMKAYLKRLGYRSMEARLPLIIEPSDEENIDLLLS